MDHTLYRRSLLVSMFWKFNELLKNQDCKDNRANKWFLWRALSTVCTETEWWLLCFWSFSHLVDKTVLDWHGAEVTHSRGKKQTCVQRAWSGHPSKTLAHMCMLRGQCCKKNRGSRLMEDATFFLHVHYSAIFNEFVTLCDRILSNKRIVRAIQHREFWCTCCCCWKLFCLFS